jgi:hypothetical protein
MSKRRAVATHQAHKSEADAPANQPPELEFDELLAWYRENDPGGMEDPLTITCTDAELAAVKLQVQDWVECYEYDLHSEPGRLEDQLAWRRDTEVFTIGWNARPKCRQVVIEDENLARRRGLIRERTEARRLAAWTQRREERGR